MCALLIRRYRYSVSICKFTCFFHIRSHRFTQFQCPSFPTHHRNPQSHTSSPHPTHPPLSHPETQGFAKCPRYLPIARNNYRRIWHPLRRFEVKDLFPSDMDSKTPTTQKGTPKTPVGEYSVKRTRRTNRCCRIPTWMVRCAMLLPTALSLALSPSITTLMYFCFPLLPLTCVEHCSL